MKNKKLALLVLGSIMSNVHGEDFINTDKELKNFSSMYDFGSPIRQEAAEATVGESLFEEVNNTIEALPAETPDARKNELAKELNITCGAKCGIVIKSDVNRS